MNVFHKQIYIEVDRFKSALTDMAWNIVSRVLEEQRSRLRASGAGTKTESRASSSPAVPSKSDKAPTPSKLDKLKLLNSKSGKWDRDNSGFYRVLGPGKEPLTFELENIATGRKINATLKTLASRWKYTP